MAKNVSSADIFGGMFQNLPDYTSRRENTLTERKEPGRQTEKQSGVAMIRREQLKAFHEHPYRVDEDQAMKDLAESIRTYGVREPILVRPVSGKEDEYEIISGHRRNHAAGMAGLKEVPVHIEELDDDTVAILMVDSNNKRETLLPSEKAWAYRIKAEAMRHQGKRNDLMTEDDMAQEKEPGGMKKVGEKNGDSERTVRRYIRLTYLRKELLNLVDESKLSVGAGYIISFFNREEQQCVWEYYQKNNRLPDTGKLEKMMQLHKSGTWNQEEIDNIMNRQPKKENVAKKGITIKKEKIKSFFPEDATDEYVESVIMELLEIWAEKQGQKC
ncbi:ParB/RepB/Spo0J family partition protein [Roseburia sp. OF03-24]|uniref:ParB/RepB/Spo0J family partition protein n=1 Tax=Roseburia sp. OF03-24 TaxID=2292367 RepID=UPI000E4F9EB7|nr:ParB/RepB/Spo0J family partition protein [Roseburia sp. OF03-24]RGX94948.1 ParB/RepB/Spo0J family partition protein [Roseburia sp. OF03-24]